MLPWKLRKRQILPVHQNLSLVYISLAKLQLVSFNLSLAMIWQMKYTHQTAKTVFSHLTSACVATKTNVIRGSSRIYKSYVDHLNVMSRGLIMVGNAEHLKEEGGQKR